MILSLMSIMIALLLDRIFGEFPHAWHPLCWFGNSAHRIESAWNGENTSTAARFILGLIALLFLVGVPVVLLIVILTLLPWWANMLLQSIVLYFCLGWQSLRQHALAITKPLTQGELATARTALSMIVSRDTSHLSPRKIAAATTESVLENGNDALFASIFWFFLLGAPAALAHRLINTLDAMWGYRNARFEYFGKSAARLDDLLGYIPARLTAISYALVGHTQRALSCWYRQANRHDSPNAGLVMASGAGALGVVLGGRANYEGKIAYRPTFGIGRRADASSIVKSLHLLQKALLVWLVVMAAFAI